MNLSERLRVFLMVMGSVVMFSVGLLAVEGGITVPSETLAAHIKADEEFHTTVVLPLITDMRIISEEQLEVFRFILRNECLEKYNTFKADSLFVSKCRELGISSDEDK